MPIQLQEFLTGSAAKQQVVKCELFAQVVSRHGKAKLKAWGTSMAPAILPGDTLIVQQGNISAFTAGDVAVYLRSGRLFAHRVIRLESKPAPVLITRGDAMECDDPPVLAAEIVGRVTSIVPGPRLTRRMRRGLSALRNAAASLFLLQG